MNFHMPDLRKKDKGSQFEEEILYSARHYQQKGFDVRLVKLETPKRTVRGKTVHLEKTGFDFMGGYRFNKHEPAQLICIEAKHIDGDRLPILRESKRVWSESKRKVITQKQGKGIKYHQLVALCDYQSMGAVAMILWKNRGKVYLLDPKFIMSEYGIGGSIRFDDTGIVNSEVPRRGLVWDFLFLLEGEKW